MKTTITLLTICFFAINISAQEVLSSVGDSFNNGNLQVDFTLGELTTETYSSGIKMTQGFNQPLLAPSSILELELDSYELFPNPAKDWVQINLDEHQNKSGWATIMDLQGRIVARQDLNDVSNARIAIDHLGAGSYLLQLSINEDNQSYKPVLIQKND